MQHIRISPLQMQARRVTSAPKDSRWEILDLARECREALGLRDRDLAVLRGLLSLMQGGSVVYASNRVLIERCDGIDERTLRRRLAHLESCGILRRQQSPNGKRYQMRDAEGPVVTYGLDLGPLLAMEPHLRALAEAERRAALRMRALRVLIRDWLYHHGASALPEVAEAARLSLRRKLSVEALEALHAGLGTEMTGSSGQNDRHIQNSDKESFEQEKADIELSECMELAAEARDMAPEVPQTWPEVVTLSDVLAPAIGLGARVLDQARQHLGRQGCALAVLGLVQAFRRIQKPEAYLLALVRRAELGRLDIVRAFRSLTQGIPG